MKKEGKSNLKNLKARLLGVCLIYMDYHELSDKKREKLKYYADKKVDDLVNYYASLLRKPERDRAGEKIVRPHGFLEVLMEHNLIPAFESNVHETLNDNVDGNGVDGTKKQ